MEHRLITGGESFLPFARSRIRALKALGMPYADQSFEIDGVSIKVRIEPGHEYIRLEGGDTIYRMDSGVVDSGPDTGPNKNVPGVLYETSHVKTYNSVFSGAGMWRTHEGKSQQASGRLTVGSSLKGYVPQDGKPARSFTGRDVEGEPEDYAGNATIQQYPSDQDSPEKKLDIGSAGDGVSEKKLAVSICPASIFTGKCRLYVQSMYGRWLTYNGSDIGTFPIEAYKGGEKVADPCLGLTPHQVPAPADETEEAKIKREAENQEQILITTSTGVYLDPITGKHWLIVVGHNEATIYRMVPQIGSKKAQKLLKRDSVDLNTADKDNLEAYVLSVSRPTHAGKKVVPITARVGPAGDSALQFSSAYGWHWNWSGNTADMVSTFYELEETDALGNDFLRMRSTHFRLSMRFVDSAPDNVSISVIQDASAWKISRRYHVVTVPDWISGSQKKLNPYRFTNPVSFSGVVFYAFYDHDALKLCSASSTIHDAVVGQRSGPFGAQEPGDLAHFGGAMTCTTTGYENNWGEVTDKDSYVDVVFSVSDEITPSLQSGVTSHKTKYEVINKTLIAMSAEPAMNWAAVNEFTDEDGTYYPPGDHNVNYYWYESVPNSISYDYVITSYTRKETGIGSVSIPHNDAQAALIKYITSYEDSDIQEVKKHITSGYSQSSYIYSRFIKILSYEYDAVTQSKINPSWTTKRIDKENSWYGIGEVYGAQITSQVTTTTDTPYVFTQMSSAADVVCRGGVYGAELSYDSIPAFFDAASDDVGSPLPVISGCALPGTVISVPLAVLENVPAGIGTPVIVGWA